MFADLEVLPEDYNAVFGNGKPVAKPVKEDNRPKFPCQSCAGTGKYQAPRVHQERSECFACGGKGFFFTSHADRMKRRASAATAKANKLQVAQEAFEAQNEGFTEVLRAMASWNDFSRDLLAQFNGKGSLSEKQVAAVWRMHAKAEETRAAKAAQRAALAVTVDLSPIHAMFAKASASGLKRPVYRAEGLKLSLAKAHSVNAGAIYVARKSGEYLGKVVGTDFKATSDAKPEDRETLLKIAANPSQVARDYGKRVGECSCCGRELTDPVSIAAGIGPICAEGWGF